MVRDARPEQMSQPCPSELLSGHKEHQILLSSRKRLSCPGSETYEVVGTLMSVLTCESLRGPEGTGFALSL